MTEDSLFVPLTTGSGASDLAAAGVIGAFKADGGVVALRDDIGDAEGVNSATMPAEEAHPLALPLNDVEVVGGPGAFELLDGTVVVPPSDEARWPVEIGPLLRRCVAVARTSPGAHRDHGVVHLPGGWMLVDPSAALTRELDTGRARRGDWQRLLDRDFADSAHYMGSKRMLLPFIMETLVDWVEPGSLMVDLMCGSGVVAGGFARRWPTVASDAMEFCRALAGVQSGGFDASRASEVAEAVLEGARDNIRWLEMRLAPSLVVEDALFHFPGGHDELASAYQAFVASFPTYPDSRVIDGWDPNEAVRSRRESPPFALPSCLFTAYFANVYVGVRQAIEIDGLRHGISQLPDAKSRRWATGALVAAVSAVATSYGGHFAQPYAPLARLSGRTLLKRVVSSRTLSVLREFEIRLLALAKTSEEIPFEIELVEGGWRNALDHVSELTAERPVTVYVDAPYGRDEYSRYYHVLETLVSYNYPSAVTAAKLPQKETGERFSSEFFTRNESRMRAALVGVLDAVLASGWRCAWSYSDAASVEIPGVLANLEHASRIRSVSAPYEYKRQGRHSRRRDVTEYLILLEP